MPPGEAGEATPSSCYSGYTDMATPGLTPSFEEAVARVAALPPQEQDTLAALVMEEIRDERRWDELFRSGRSPALLERLAAEAVAEDDAGLTEPVGELFPGVPVSPSRSAGGGPDTAD